MNVPTNWVSKLLIAKPFNIRFHIQKIRSMKRYKVWKNTKSLIFSALWISTPMQWLDLLMSLILKSSILTVLCVSLSLNNNAGANFEKLFFKVLRCRECSLHKGSNSPASPTGKVNFTALSLPLSLIWYSLSLFKVFFGVPLIHIVILYISLPLFLRFKTEQKRVFGFVFPIQDKMQIKSTWNKAFDVECDPFRETKPFQEMFREV